MSKRILVFCDGTGADANAIDIPTGVGFAIGQWATNVVRLSRSVKPISADGFQQIVFYQSGVGSVTDFNASTVAGTTITQGTGLAVATKIREAYAFIAQNYQDGDEICLFGFSRGAYTARKIAGLIDALGLLNTADLGSFFKYWAKLANGETVTKPGRDTKIKCVGVWDTVGSVLGLTDALHISDNELPASVVTALQAVSFQENRRNFLPTLWVPPASGLVSGQTLTEVWFPGAHCDVGGGYQRHELADLALFWMADKLTYPLVSKNGNSYAAIIDLDLDFVTKCRQSTTDAWGNTQPNNGWTGLPIGLPKTRLDLCQSDNLYHQSILSAPTALDSNYFMITLDDLKKKFSTSTSTWTPTCPDLGTYEQDRKDNWNDSNSSPITFEHERELFNPVIWVKTDLAIPIVEIIQVGNYNNVAACVARVADNNGLYPGTAAPHIPLAWYGTGTGSEYSTTDYEVLVGEEKKVQWVPVESELQTSKIPDGTTLVNGGYDGNGTTFYIARYKGWCGKVQMGKFATYTNDGVEYTAFVYDVLVYNNLGQWMPSVGEYATANSSAVQINSTTISINEMVSAPVVAVGLNKLDMSLDTNIRVIAFADGISTTSFTAHINSWDNTTLYNASLSWITLAANDPRYQCGYWALECDPSNYNDDTKPVLSRTITQRVNFDTGFNSQPKVFVGISGMDFKGDLYLSVAATDIDVYGFTMNVFTAANTTLYGIKVDWIAYLPNEANMWSGSVSYNSGNPTTVDFGIHFLNTPTIFTAITQFDISNGYNLRVKVDTNNVTNQGMDITVSKWSDTIVNSVTVGYLAADTQVGA